MNIEMVNPIEEKVLEYKRFIHTHPEIGWQEVSTSAYIKERLGAVSLIEGLGQNNTGAAFVLGEGKTSIFVRADIDALKTSSGPQHLCGHSTHTAALMGAYHWLKDHETELTANGKKVMFVFQPAEEIFPSGARTFLDTNPEIFAKSQYGFGVHVQPRLPVGSVQIQSGPTWAASDYVEVEIHGFTAHVKDTPQGIDAIEGAAHVVQLFRNYQKEFENFGREVVFNFNTIQGGVASNCIADNTLLRGQIRWLRKVDQARVKDFFTNLPQRMKQLYPGDIDIRYVEENHPVCNNDEILAKEVSDYMENRSELTVERGGPVSLGVEDFAFYTRQFRTLYSHVGVGSAYDLHDPRMVVSDDATLKVYTYWRNLLQWWINKQLV